MKVRLFNTKKECENGIKLKYERKKLEQERYCDYEIKEFMTRG